MITIKNDIGCILQLNDDGTAIQGWEDKDGKTKMFADDEDVFRLSNRRTKFLGMRMELGHHLDTTDLCESVRTYPTGTIIISVGNYYSGTSWHFENPPQEAMDWFKKWLP